MVARSIIVRETLACDNKALLAARDIPCAQQGAHMWFEKSEMSSHMQWVVPLSIVCLRLKSWCDACGKP